LADAIFGLHGQAFLHGTVTMRRGAGLLLIWGWAWCLRLGGSSAILPYGRKAREALQRSIFAVGASSAAMRRV